MRFNNKLTNRKYRSTNCMSEFESIFINSVAFTFISLTRSTIKFNMISIDDSFAHVLLRHKCNRTCWLVIYVPMSRTSCTCVGGRERHNAVLRGSLNLLGSPLCLDVTLISYLGKSHPPTRWSPDIVPSHETASCSARVDVVNKFPVKVYFTVFEEDLKLIFQPNIYSYLMYLI